MIKKILAYMLSFCILGAWIPAVSFASEDTPVIRGNNVVRTKDGQVSIRFSSNVSGNYYYKITDNVNAPSADDIVSEGSEKEAKKGINIVTISNVEPGKKWVHIVVKNTDEVIGSVLTLEMPKNVYYFEDFEVYEENTYVGSGKMSPIWQQHSGTGSRDQKVVSDSEKGKILSLSSTSSWASDQDIMWQGMIPSDKSYVFEGDVKATSGDSAWQLRFSLKNDKFEGINEAGIYFKYGRIVAITDEQKILKHSYNANQWYHIKIVANPMTKKYAVYVDEELLDDNLTISENLIIDRAAISAGHSKTAHFDNLKFYVEDEEESLGTTAPEETPNAIFTATDSNVGYLSNLKDGAYYHVSGAATKYFKASENEGKLENVQKGMLRIVKIGNGETTSDSAAQTIEVGKLEPASMASAVDCTDSENNDGKIVDVEDGVEYRKQPEEEWIPVPSQENEVTGLTPGTYEVRFKAKESRLASDSRVLIIRPAGEPVAENPVMPYIPSVESERQAIQNAQISDGKSQKEIDINVDKQNSSATVELKDTKLFSGKDIVVTIPQIEEIINNVMAVEVSKLSKKRAEESITLKTSIADIVLPSNMLTDGEKMTGNRAEISLAKIKKEDLPVMVQEKVGNRPVVSLNLSIDTKPFRWQSKVATVKVSIPYHPSPKELENPDRITVYYIDAGGNFLEMKDAKYHEKAKAVVFTTTHFSRFAVGYKGDDTDAKGKFQFKDVKAGDWYYDAVTFISGKKITNGTGNGMFHPEADLTRGQFMVMLMRAYEIEADRNGTDNFNDAGNTYYTNYLAAAKRIGISKGIGNNQFAPEKTVSREEMFTLLYNALKVMNRLPKKESGKVLSDFADAKDVSEWAREAMNALVKNGTLIGSENNVKPKERTNRAEMAQILYHLLSANE